jgi:hypothetical protein
VPIFFWFWASVLIWIFSHPTTVLDMSIIFLENLPGSGVAQQHLPESSCVQLTTSSLAVSLLETTYFMFHHGFCQHAVCISRCNENLHSLSQNGTVEWQYFCLGLSSMVVLYLVCVSLNQRACMFI